ncbi:MAG: HEAT repeat domain-containing protein, partial [Ignavibacteriae bacterium]|nr:HEAT repeat domain-containing protein [Ignavibacteriota bacterium]
RIDKEKGIAAYELFIKQYPESVYLDDAVADMNENMTLVVTPGTENIRVKTAPGAYAYSFGSTVRSSERSLRQVERAMRATERELRRTGVATPRPPMAWGLRSELQTKKKLDPQTRLKLDALYALGESENDKDAFATLKEVALDKSQPEIIRIAAIESLEDFHKFDVLPIFLEVAKSDGEELQVIAIHSIADIGSDKNKSVDALISLFTSSPKKEKQQQSSLYAIADIGNDKAVDFLVKIATTHDNYELRSDAVYYLGNIGNAKSRAALQQILKAK